MNLLSLFSASPEASGGLVQSAANGEAGDVALIEGEMVAAEGGETGQFGQMFEGKLGAIEGAVSEGEAMPAPKLMAAFLQRLHMIVPEGEGISAANQGLIQLSDEQMSAMAQVMGITPEMLQANIEGSDFSLAEISALAGQNLPQQGADLPEVAQGLMQLLQQFAELGQKLHQSGMALVGAGVQVQALNPEPGAQPVALTEAEVDLPLGIVLSGLVFQNERPDGFGLPEELGRELPNLAQLLGTAPADISETITPLVGSQNKDSLDLTLLSTQPVLAQENSATSTAPLVKEAVSAEPLLTSAAAVTTLAKPLEEKAESRILPLNRGEVASDEGGDVPLAALRQGAERAEASKPLSSFLANNREAATQLTATIQQQSSAPLLRETLDRPANDRPIIDSGTSSLSFNAIDSKLDFDAKLRETRSFAARNPAQEASVRDQVAVQVKNGLDKGDTRISVTLRPAELGRVDVRVELGLDGRATLAVFADNRDTLEMLQRDSRSLERAFADLGMEMSDSGMSFDLNEQFSGGQEEDQEGQSSFKEGDSSFDHLLGGESPADLIAEALLDSPQMSYMVGVDDGLNIKV